MSHLHAYRSAIALDGLISGDASARPSIPVQVFVALIWSEAEETPFPIPVFGPGYTLEIAQAEIDILWGEDAQLPGQTAELHHQGSILARKEAGSGWRLAAVTPSRGRAALASHRGWRR